MNTTQLLASGAALAVGAVAAYLLASPKDPVQAAKPGAPLVAISVPVNLSAGATMGKQAFDAKCAACHGGNAVGQEGVAPPLVHKIYESSHHGDLSFVRAVESGVRAHHWPFGNMPPVEGLTTAEVKSIIAYVRELQRENGIF